MSPNGIFATSGMLQATQRLHVGLGKGKGHPLRLGDSAFDRQEHLFR